MENKIQAKSKMSKLMINPDEKDNEADNSNALPDHTATLLSSSSGSRYVVPLFGPLHNLHPGSSKESISASVPGSSKDSVNTGVPGSSKDSVSASCTEAGTSTKLDFNFPSPHYSWMDIRRPRGKGNSGMINIRGRGRSATNAGIMDLSWVSASESRRGLCTAGDSRVGRGNTDNICGAEDNTSGDSANLLGMWGSTGPSLGNIFVVGPADIQPFLHLAGMEDLVFEDVLARLPIQYWCTVTYYEMDEKIGESYKVPYAPPKVSIDMSTDSTDLTAKNRICLGTLTNDNRTEKCKEARSLRTKGVQFYLCNERDVVIMCRDPHPVVVQSYYLDREAGRPMGSAVHKIYSERYIKIFDLRLSFNQMKDYVTSFVYRNLGPSITAPVYDGGLSLMDKLKEQCVIPMSFVGTDKTVHNSDCWMELSVNNALQLMDQILLHYHV